MSKETEPDNSIPDNESRNQRDDQLEQQDQYEDTPKNAAEQESDQSSEDTAEAGKPQQGNKLGNIPGLDPNKAASSVAGAVGGEKGQKAVETAQKAQEVAKKTSEVVQDIKKFAAGVKSAFSWLLNPYVLAVIGALLVISLIITAVLSNIQVYGTQTKQGGASASQEMLERLAQRAVLLQDTATNETTSSSWVSARGGNMKNDNSWDVACPDIVGIIYGLPDNYISRMGHSNAKEAYNRMVSAGIEPAAYAFNDGTMSPGATLLDIPAGAIVSSGGSSSAGHTFVVLTEEGHVIDNTWRIPNKPGQDPPIRDFTSEQGGILGWVLPPSEGYEGTFLDDASDLPAVPEWAKAS